MKRQPRFRVIATVYLVLRRRGRVLLSRRCNTGFHDGEYSLPSGHVEGGETLVEALIRESKEELGIALQRKHLALAHVLHRKEQEEERLNFFFLAGKWRGHPNNREPHKCDDLRWAGLTALPSNTIPYVRQALACVAKGIAYDEFGW